MSRTYNWCFTTYESPNDLKEHLLGNQVSMGIGYVIYQLENCPKTGKLHAQGYVEFIAAKTLSAVKKQFRDNTMHLEEAKGNAAHNFKYCSKSESSVPDTLYEWGKAKNQGKRTDLEAVALALTTGEMTMRDLMTELPGLYVRYHKGFEALLNNIFVPTLTLNLRVLWYFGPPGTGKTRVGFDRFGPEGVARASYKKSADEWWFNSYKPGVTQCLMFDDVQPVMFEPGGVMLQYLDIYPIDLPTKGGFVKRRSEVIMITSNWDPVRGKKRVAPEYLRRVHSFVYVGMDGKEEIFVNSEPVKEL